MDFIHNECQVVVIGAGISGLATAAWLDAAGVKVMVLESAPQAGGVMRSERLGDFLVETGPNSLLETTPAIAELIALAGIQNQVVYPDRVANRRYVLRQGKLLPLPMNPLAFLSTSLFSGGAKLRVLREPFIKSAPALADESIAGFVRRRLGDEILDYAVNPFVAGVFAGDPEQLSVRAAFPKLYALEQEYGSLIRGAIRGRKEKAARVERAKDRARMLSFLEGMGALPAALHRRLGAKVRLGVSAMKISTASDRIWRVEFVAAQNQTTSRANGGQEIYAPHVVMTVPAFGVPALFADGLARRLVALREVVYAPVAIVATGFRRERVPHTLQGFGFLTPEKEKRSILGTLWNSTLFPGRAPKDQVLLTSFVGGMRQPALIDHEDRDLRRLVLGDLRDLLGISAAPDFIHLRRYHKAIPQCLIGHQRFLDLMDEAEREFPGLYFATNYRGGVSVTDCIQQARETATKIQNRVKAKVKILEEVDCRISGAIA